MSVKLAPRGHKMLTQEIRKSLPALYSQEENADPIVRVKYFSPYSNWSWFGIEFDGEDIFFGLVSGFEIELGNFSLKELEELDFGGGLPAIERDCYWTPKPLSAVRESLEKTGWA